MEYLEELTPAPSILPAGIAARAHARSIAAAIACEAQPFMNLRMQKYLKQERDFDDAAINEWLNHWSGGAMAAVEKIVAGTGGDYCVGDQPSMADICLVPQMFGAMRFGIDVSGFTRLNVIYERCLKHPAFEKAHPSAGCGEGINMTPLIFAIGDKKPKIHATAFIAPGAVIAGDVEVHENASVWYGSVLRGDENKIVVGKGSNVQDGTIIHVDNPDWGGLPTIIGENVLVGHRCLLHGATVEDGGFVGMGATMLDGSVVKTGAMLAAGAFLSPKKIVPAGELCKFRDLREGEDKFALIGSGHYVEEANRHRAALAK